MDTAEFTLSAQHFEAFGCYTKHPVNTSPSSRYMKFWKQEERRCLEGYNIGSDRITGFHYFYLNYFPIVMVEAVKNKNVKDSKIHGERITGFPRFWDLDYNYFHYLDAAAKGKHAVVMKSRGKGFSYKNASMLNRNFFLIPGSKNYAVAFEKEYLISDGILTKAWDNMDFINEHTAWAKRRTKDTPLHRRAAYKIMIEGRAIEKGYKSEIIGVSLKDNPNRIRGKRGNLILFEEAGRFPGLLQAWQIARNSMEQGPVTFGLMIAFGTGGTVGADFSGLEELFYRPKAYNIYAIPNVYDDNAGDSVCGFFAPEYMNMEGYYDKNGKSDIECAMAKEMEERKMIAKEARDKMTLIRYCAEKPFKPSEAIMRFEGVKFPVTDLKYRLGYLEANDKLRNAEFIGELILDEENRIVWKENTNLVPIVDFPVRTGTHTTGCIVIFQHPYTDETGKVPYGLYIAGTDPYDQDKSNTGSLGSTLVYDRVNKLIVAEYTGRPETAKQYYENVRKLLLYYNCATMYENERKGLFDYFEYKNCLYLLANEPEIIHDVIAETTVSRKKGMHMTTGIKEYGEIMINTMLIEQRQGVGAEQDIMNLHKIRSVPLLKELIAYDGIINTDRVVALMCIMYYEAEIRKMQVGQQEHIKTILDDPFWNTDPFKKKPKFAFDLNWW